MVVTQRDACPEGQSTVVTQHGGPLDVNGLFVGVKETVKISTGVRAAIAARDL
jgi:hypothetical protein